MKWKAVQQLHEEAVESLAASAERIPAPRWLLPRSEGKWSPAETVEHLNLAYDVLLREIAGGEGMQIRTKLWQRILLRMTLVPKLLRGVPFPAGARAPRETRPVLITTDQAAAIDRFRDRAARFQAAANEARSEGNRVRLTHAYFGRSSVADALVLCARHVQHHERQLRAVGG